MAFSPPYSSQLIVFTPLSPSDTFEVPAGMTAVIRDVTCYDPAGGSYAQVFIQDDDSAPRCMVAQAVAVGVPGYGQWTGRVVVPGGGFILLITTTVGDEPDVYVGGYLLQGP